MDVYLEDFKWFVSCRLLVGMLQTTSHEYTTVDGPVSCFSDAVHFLVVKI